MEISEIEGQTMNVSLTPELEEFVAKLVETGRFRSASEVVRSAIRLLQDLEAERIAKLEALRGSSGACPNPRHMWLARRHRR